MITQIETLQPTKKPTVDQKRSAFNNTKGITIVGKCMDDVSTTKRKIIMIDNPKSKPPEAKVNIPPATQTKGKLVITNIDKSRNNPGLRTRKERSGKDLHVPISQCKK